MFKIYTYGLFLSLGIITGLYYFWKLGKDEHYEEISLFDAFFLSLFTYFVAGRASYVLANNFTEAEWLSALSILTIPGLSVLPGIVMAILVLALISRVKGWEFWKTMDIASVTLGVILVFGNLGSLINGGNLGKLVNWSVDLLSVIYAVISFIVVFRVRKNFRFYSWYKRERAIAKDGLSALVFLVLSGFYFGGRYFLEQSSHLSYLLLAAGLVVYGVIAIYRRSGRKFELFSVKWLRKGRAI